MAPLVNQDPPGGALGPLDRIVLGFHAVVAIALLAWALVSCRAGIDFTDEGYYLNWLSGPQRFPASVTQFGFVYQPLYWLLGGDVAHLRQANILLTFALGAVMFALVFRPTPPTDRSLGRWRAASAAACAASSLAFLCFWLPTPSYRSLTLQALLLAAIGVLLAQSESRRASHAGYTVIGLAGALAFLAKPTSAVALAFLVPLALLDRGAPPWRGLLGAALVAFASLAASALAIDGSIAGFVQRNVEGVADVQAMQGGYATHHLLRLDAPRLDFDAVALLVATAMAVTLALIRLRPTTLAGALLPTLMSLAFPGAVLAAMAGGARIPLSPHQLGLGFFALVLSTLCAIAVARRGAAVPPRSARSWCWPVAWIAWPYAYAIGTNGNYWQAMAESAIFWLAGGAWLLLAAGPTVPLRLRALLPLAGFSQAAVLAILFASTNSPYRQAQPLHQQSELLALPADRGALRVTADSARYLRTIAAAARQNGFRPGDPLLDLTGRFPFTVYYLEGTPPGLAWTLGGYPGTPALTQRALARVPPGELRRAWLLTEPKGPWRIPLSSLAAFGLDPARDYREVATVKTPATEFSSDLQQVLLKPRRMGEP